MNRIAASLFVLPFCSLLLFGAFITSSSIPEAVEYVQRQQIERRLRPSLRDKLFAELRKIASSAPPFILGAARNPEAIQYGIDFMEVFFAAGLRLQNGPVESASPLLFDLNSPALRGLLLAVKNPQAPPVAALNLGDALRQAGVPFNYMGVRTDSNDYVAFVVGYK